MRWDGQLLSDAGSGVRALPGLEGVGRTVTTPEFEGITFHEVLCKSALNKLPESSAMPFSWTVNPYRGCTHACTYCFARSSHEYLEFDAGGDFDSQIVVKTNLVPVLKKELRRASWRGEPVALGTNTDPYQRAEGRYRLMPGVIGALAGAGSPISILTKGTLLRRDLPLLTTAATRVPVQLSVSLALLDPELQRSLEPGTPKPEARLELIRAIAEAGFDCHVMVAPVVPYLTDDAASLRALIAALADAGAASASVMALNLTGRYRDWFLGWLSENHPMLVRRYRQLYGSTGRVSADYRTHLRARVTPMLEEFGMLRLEDPYASPPQRVPRAPRVDGSAAPDLQESLF
ncbi:Rv2578c family radical SAM protein [Tsukamurella tyrosinosolvens]|uniref:Rv2578c family radical SAM protein n=1 Tax=Tsukamurella tyrosinosolvens TaxID=57704 RepID=UPI000796FF40|nr:Rv2578c family radical SAM protein [Tsukamurella tyrosinosolvens]KXP05832.1 radical SAM protein [Tsukamurella tyrosinosolvens]KZL95665.1 radical SAM protein [Tsukamurella tyrosinosolvens]MCA4993548.1 Rv2578c family radical SAM protein [Tsukamurella tyrosinosolvens]WEL94942.1 Rv2578c family radical SAM protein [Tsukamurella tyrosinosolvens]